MSYVSYRSESAEEIVVNRAGWHELCQGFSICKTVNEFAENVYSIPLSVSRLGLQRCVARYVWATGLYLRRLMRR